MFVDKVRETHHPIFTTCKTQKLRTENTLQFTLSHAWSLTPQLHQFGQDDETGLLGNRVRDVHSTLDDGEYDSLHVFCTWQPKKISVFISLSLGSKCPDTQA